MSFAAPPGDYAISSSQPISRVNIQAVMKLVYLWMGLGLLTTTVVAWFFGTNESLMAIAMNPVVAIGSIIGTFALVIAISFGFSRQWMTPNIAMILFFVYAGLMGILLSSVAFLATVDGSMSRAVVSALSTTIVLFGVMTVFGYTTKMDLTKWGTYLLIGLIGIVVAMIVNLFLRSDGLSLLISVIGVFIFTGLTAYDTQKIKEMTETYELQSDGNLALKFSIFGALTLYLDFVNLFLFLLRIFMSRE